MHCASRERWVRLAGLIRVVRRQPGLWLLAAVLGLSGCGSADGEREAQSGEQVYQRFCFSCHTAGAAGAPRTGDVDAWRPRIAQGRDVLIRHTIEGMPPGMPAKGLCMQCTDQELIDAVDYMVERSQ